MSYRRGWITAFLFALPLINYMDRVALSIAAKPIAERFHLSTIDMGFLFSAFIWSYAICLLPMGALLDRFGVKRVASGGIFVWSIATLATGCATSFLGILAARLVMGGGESCTNPVGATVIRQWYPSRERGFTTALFNSGSYAGPAICSILLAFLVSEFGWEASFFIAGGVGFLWLLAWMLWFNPPEVAPWLPAPERAFILAERHGRGQRSERNLSHGMGSLLKSPTLWGLALAQGCNVYTQYLCLTWLPSYMEATRHLSVQSSGFLSAVPYAVAVLLCILTGRASDIYVGRKGTMSGHRRNAVALTMLLGATILAVPFTQNLHLLILVFSLALTGVASTSSLNFSLVSDLLGDPGSIGKAMAFVVMGGNLFGLAAPIVTGFVVNAHGKAGYGYAFGVAGVLLLAGAGIVLTMTRRPI